MEELKKAIIDNLYKSNFYEALTNIQKLETSFPDAQETLFFYYYLYDLMSWVSHHKKHDSVATIQNNKDMYFNQLLQSNQNDESTTYLQLYLFLEKNFRTFEHYTWFRKYDKSKYLLEQALKENPDKLEVQFYILQHEEKTKECFEFLNKNTLDTQIVQKFLNSLWFKDEFLDDSQKLKQLYNLNSEHNTLFYYTQKKDYNWLYDYFNEDEEKKSKTNTISYGKVCFELKKYDEAIEHYAGRDDISSNDFFVLGECYEKQGQKEKAIQCYKNYYNNFRSGNWNDGIKKLFELECPQ
ncbi:tetratricopeptide repeat protein [Sulfurimonas sp.]|uniref:tetratricopeptide repeat protein n=1 Tax=Sulfurimonas sp. TaxID=2022749 RepID=UPI003D0C301B